MSDRAMVTAGQTLTATADIANLPDGSIISWLGYSGDPEDEIVGVVQRYPDGSASLNHTGSAYWMTFIEDLNPVPCTVIRVGRSDGE
ncbi:hypothetical protein [Nocardia sp. N2S4-5]|uniref:hypothetical protein n=1 Tax=Nocardia sp. N2S4-5 TaxID=3351565 RepID=UPI0037D70BD6